MAKIIVLGAMKGGVGKSVSAFNLAYSLAELGKKVLAVDDVVLIKASNSMNFKEIVNSLIQH